MSALSLSQINELLAFYTPSDGSILPRINQTLARLYQMGTYRDLTVQYSLPVANGLITLPDDADAILHALVDGQPSPVRSLWHDFKSNGLESSDMSWGLVDAGFGPVLRELPVTTDTLHVIPSAESTTQIAFDQVNGGIIEITAVSELRIMHTSTADISFDGEQLIFDSDLVRVTQIRYDGLQDRYDICTDAVDPETVIATVGPGSGVARYRRFRLPGATDGQTTVHVLCKRAFRPLVEDEDVTHMGNINAIKNGFLATVAEDANDLERSEAFWNKCFQLLEEEAASTRGAAQPRLSLDPFGAEGKFGIRGIM